MNWTRKFEMLRWRSGILQGTQGKSFGDELGAILDTFVDLVEWLEERFGSVKETAKEQVEKFKRKIKEFKKLNGAMNPEQLPTEMHRYDAE